MSLENATAESELAALAQQLAENPETRKDFLRLTKKVKPDLPIPELDIEERASQVYSKADARVQELETKLKQKEAVEELERRRQTLVKKGLVDAEDDIKDVEKLMLERGITNHETAAEYHRWMKEAAKPTPSGYNPSLFKKINLSKYWKNPVMAARDEASKALNELRQPRRPIGL